jgi:hypothetical protein
MPSLYVVRGYINKSSFSNKPEVSRPVECGGVLAAVRLEGAVLLNGVVETRLDGVNDGLPAVLGVTMVEDGSGGMLRGVVVFDGVGDSG